MNQKKVIEDFLESIGAKKENADKFINNGWDDIEIIAEMEPKDFEEINLDGNTKARIKVWQKKRKNTEFETPVVKIQKVETPIKPEIVYKKMKTWDFQFTSKEMKENFKKITTKLDEETILGLLNEKNRISEYCESQKLQQNYISNTSLSFFQALR